LRLGCQPVEKQYRVCKQFTLAEHDRLFKLVSNLTEGAMAKVTAADAVRLRQFLEDAKGFESSIQAFTDVLLESNAGAEAPAASFRLASKPCCRNSSTTRTFPVRAARKMGSTASSPSSGSRGSAPAFISRSIYHGAARLLLLAAIAGRRARVVQRAPVGLRAMSGVGSRLEKLSHLHRVGSCSSPFLNQTPTAGPFGPRPWDWSLRISAKAFAALKV